MWLMDPIQWHNNKMMMFYNPSRNNPANGLYITIDSSGELNGGTYEGAGPHITDAIFDIAIFCQKSIDQESMFDAAIKFWPELSVAFTNALQRLREV